MSWVLTKMTHMKFGSQCRPMDEFEVLDFLYFLLRLFIVYVGLLFLGLLLVDRFTGLVLDQRGLFIVATFVALLLIAINLIPTGEDEGKQEIKKETTPQFLESVPGIPKEEISDAVRGPTLYLLSQFLAIISGGAALIVFGLTAEGMLGAALAGTFTLMPYALWEARKTKRDHQAKGIQFERRGVTIGKFIVLAMVLLFVAHFAGIAFLPELFAPSL
jgi:hypothetical protein